jgi:hypothetical protein
MLTKFEFCMRGIYGAGVLCGVEHTTAQQLWEQALMNGMTLELLAIYTFAIRVNKITLSDICLVPAMFQV